MLSKKFTKKLVGTILSLVVFSGVAATLGSKDAYAVPANEDKYVEGDRQFTVNLSTTEISAGSNPGAVDFNGNGKYDDNEMLPLKGTEDFVLSNAAQAADENFLSIVGVEGGILRNNTMVMREDVSEYKKAYLRDTATGGYAYIKVKFDGAVGEALKATLNKAVEEFKKNQALFAQNKGNEISLVEQETLATVIQNSLGMLDESKNLVNKDFYVNITYKTGAKTETMKVSVLDLLMDTTTSKVNQYANAYNAPKIVDADGNVYLKVYGLPSGSEITDIAFEGTLQFPSLVESSVVKKVSKQTAVEGKKGGIIPFIDPLLTENVNVDNSNPLDPLAIKATSTYFVDISKNDKGQITTEPNKVVEYIGPVSDDDKLQGYKHANVRPLEDSVVFYDALYDPENTIKRIQVKDINGQVYSGVILKEAAKVGNMQAYGKVDNIVKDAQKNAAEYKDFAIQGLKPGTDYKFTELIVTFNSGNGDINRRFTNYDTISMNPLTIRTRGKSDAKPADGLLTKFEVKNIGATKAEFTVELNDKDGIVKDVRIEGDSIAKSVYDAKNNLVTLYGLVPNNQNKDFELVVTLADGQELGMKLEPFTTAKVTNAKSWIEGFYHTFFLRDGDPDGMAYWTSKLSSHEVSVNYFTSNIVNEQEYKEKNLDNTKYVERMYRSVTGRTSDEEGLKFWVKTLEDTIAKTGNRIEAMQSISQRMLGETETKNFLFSLGLNVE